MRPAWRSPCRSVTRSVRANCFNCRYCCLSTGRSSVPRSVPPTCRVSRVYTEAGRTTLYVDLARPLVGTEQPRREGTRPNALLTVHLRPARAGPVTGQELPFPDAVPVGARFREGALALDCDEQLFHLDVKTTADRSEPSEEGPWGKQAPEYFYRYRGQPVTGTLRVQVRPPRLRAKCGSEVFVASGRAAVETHLLLEAEVGSPDTIDLALSEGGGERWEWENEPAARGEASSGNRVLRVERRYVTETVDALQGLAARTPLEAAALFAARPGGEHWRLTLAQPLRARQPLRLHAVRSLQQRPDGWHVPLPVVLGAARMEGEVTLHLAGADVVQVHSAGLSEAVSTPTGAGTPWRTFRYGQTHVALTLSGHSTGSGRTTEAVIDRARLTTRVGTRDVVQYHFSFQVANWRQRVLPLRLPSGSRPVAVQIDGHWLPRLISACAGDGGGSSCRRRGRTGLAGAHSRRGGGCRDNSSLRDRLHPRGTDSSGLAEHRGGRSRPAGGPALLSPQLAFAHGSDAVVRLALSAAPRNESFRTDRIGAPTFQCLSLAGLLAPPRSFPRGCPGRRRSSAYSGRREFARQPGWEDDFAPGSGERPRLCLPQGKPSPGGGFSGPARGRRRP